MVFAEGPADLADFPGGTWATAFPEAGCGMEFTVLLFAYRKQVTHTWVWPGELRKQTTSEPSSLLPSCVRLGKLPP